MGRKRRRRGRNRRRGVEERGGDGEEEKGKNIGQIDLSVSLSVGPPMFCGLSRFEPEMIRAIRSLL